MNEYIKPNCEIISSEQMSDQKNDHNYFGMTGWICPVCGRGLSPYTSFCPCRPYEVTNIITSGEPFLGTVATNLDHELVRVLNEDKAL